MDSIHVGCRRGTGHPPPPPLLPSLMPLAGVARRVKRPLGDKGERSSGRGKTAVCLVCSRGVL